MNLSLAQLAERAGIGMAAVPAENAGRPVSGVAYDSRAVRGGEVFVAIKGTLRDGADFADDARRRGASAVVAGTEAPAGWVIPWIRVEDPRVALASLAAAYYGHPSRDLLVVGTTGTNGKTTTTYFVQAILRAAGFDCGRIGSIVNEVGGEEYPSERTTPEAPDLQRLLRAMVDAGQRGCALEVSSHALAQRRTDGVRCRAAIFTNLMRDHLDFHGDMARYFAAKRRLFDGLPDAAPAVINVDDAWGRRLAADLPRAVTYALEAPANVRPERVAYAPEGIALDISTPRGQLALRSRLVGRANAYNIVAAAAVGVALELETGAVEKGVRALVHVPGRMQWVSDAADTVRVLVDFAHTDDALKQLLVTARKLAPGRLITVFGCGGDRDRTKRPLMGSVAGRLSDLVVVTTDNPRSEDPAAIADDVERGLASGAAEWVTRLDRAEAITYAVCIARPGDLVIVAGKGHERHQEIAGHRRPFQDAAVAREALDRRRQGVCVG